MFILKTVLLKLFITMVICSFWNFVAIANNSRTIEKIEPILFRSLTPENSIFFKKFLRGIKFKVKSDSKISKLNTLIKTKQFSNYSFTQDSINLYKSFFSKFPFESQKKKYILYDSNLNLNKSIYIKSLSRNKLPIKEKEVKKDKIFLMSFSEFSQSESPNKLNDISPLKMENWGETILTLVISLIFILLLIYFIAYIYKKFFSNRLLSFKGNVSIRQVSSYYLGPKQKIIVFDFNGRMFACGVTPSSINLITELYNEDDSLSFENSDGSNPKKEAKKSTSNFLKTLEPELIKNKQKDIS